MSNCFIFLYIINEIKFVFTKVNPKISLKRFLTKMCDNFASYLHQIKCKFSIEYGVFCCFNDDVALEGAFPVH